MKKRLLLSYWSLLIVHCIFSQNVGIGTNAPTRAKLEVHGAVGATSAIFGGETTGISLQSNWPAIGFNQYYDNVYSKYIANGFAAVQYLDPTTGELGLVMLGPGNANTNVTSIQRAFTISNSGNMGIKTSPFPTASLYVVKAGNSEGAAVFGGTSHNSYFYYGVDEHTYIRGGRDDSYVYLNDIPGSVIFGGGTAMVGINSGSPAYTLEIAQLNNKGLLLVDPAFNLNSWEYRVNYYYNAPHSDLRLYYNGVASSYISATDGQFHVHTSDSRIKTNIKALPPVLDRMNRLQPSVYEMKDHNYDHEKTFGFIAQDVKSLFPELVTVKQVIVDSVNRIPDLHALNYTGFSVIAIKALQEQYKQIQALQKENDELMKRLDALDKKLLQK